MTIKRGEDWGTSADLPPDAPVVATDARLADLVAEATPLVGLVGGDLAKTVGGGASESELRAGPRTNLPVDVVEVEIDGRRSIAVAHIVVRRPLWLRPAVAVMNAAFIGEMNLAPRSHPNDGRIEVVTSRLGIADLLKARRRVASGTHVPHPDIDIERRTEGEIRPENGARVFVDGEPLGRAEVIRYQVRPDAVTIVI